MIVAGALMAACLLRALSWQFIGHGESALKLTPHGESLLTVACLSVPIFPAMALLWSAITRRLKRRITITLVLMIVLGAMGGFVSRVAWDQLFQGHYGRSAISPDGSQEAHLFVDGFLECRGTLFVSERRGVFGTPFGNRVAACGDEVPRWVEDGGIEISESPAEPVKLYWGPH